MTAGRISLEEVADRMAIGDVLTRYTRAIDTKNIDWLDDVFTPDADIDYSSSGGIAGKYPEVKDWLAKALAPFAVFQHFIGNTSYEIDGDRASTRSYFVNPMLFKNPDGSDHIFTVYGYYVDRLARTDAGWRIERRVEEQALLEGTLPKALQIPT